MATLNGVELQELTEYGSQEAEDELWRKTANLNVSEHRVQDDGDDVQDFKIANQYEAGLCRRLARKHFRPDSLGVESLHDRGMEQGPPQGPQPASFPIVLRMAFETIGVVFGDLGTSPLYVFSSTFSKGQINDNIDILGVLSLILYTLIIIPLIKYVFIVLRADDNGEGGTFALYSLICRHAKIGMAHNQTSADVNISSYRLSTQTKNSERAARIKSVLLKSKFLQNVLLIVVLVGPCLVIGDGSLTPAISVLSATQGIGVQVPSLSSDKVLVSITVVVLIVLFMLQQFGTQKVAFLFAPAMLIWFFTIGIIGLYNIIKWDPTIFKAMNPFYAFSYFKRNKKKAWISLGGVVLCITGTEAMFADLGHFNVRSIQVAFSGLVFPSLCCAYIGQAAFLMKNQAYEDVAFTFYRSIPRPIFWPMFVISTMAAIIASQAMISATYSTIRNAMALGCFPRVSVIHTSKTVGGQIYIPEINWVLMILSITIVATFRSTTQIGNAYGVAVVGVFFISTSLLTLVMAMIWETNLYLSLAFLIVIGTIEGVYFSSVLYKVIDGGWVPLAIAACFMIVMYSWNYGTRMKYEFEFSHKLPLEWILGLYQSLGIARVPGIGLVYTEVPQGVPAIFAHWITNLPATHSVLVFVCIRNIAVSTVPDDERIIIKRIGPPEYRMFRCAVRYGYTDQMGKEANQSFEDLLFKSLESYTKYGSAGNVCITVMSSSLVETPVVSASVSAPEGEMCGGLKNLSAHSSAAASETFIQDEVLFLQKAREAGVMYLLGTSEVHCKEGASIFKRIVIDYVYSFCHRNFRRNTVFLGIPRARMLKVGMTYHV